MEYSSQGYWSGLHCLLQRTFLTQGSNPCLLLGRWILYNQVTWEVVQQVHGCSNACLLSYNENKTKKSYFSPLCKDCKHFSLLHHLVIGSKPLSALGTLPAALEVPAHPPAPSPRLHLLQLQLPRMFLQHIQLTRPRASAPLPHRTPTHGHLCLRFVQASVGISATSSEGAPFSSFTCIWNALVCSVSTWLPCASP